MGWNGVVALVDRLEITDQAAKLPVPGHIQLLAAGEEAVQVQRPEGRDLQLPLAQLLRRKLEHMGHFRQFFIGAAVQGQEPPVGQTVVFFLFQQALIQRFQLPGL